MKNLLCNIVHSCQMDSTELMGILMTPVLFMVPWSIMLFGGS